jgi:hypothetical protein
VRKRLLVVAASLVALFVTGAGVVWLAPQGWVKETLVRRFESATGLRVDARDVQTDWHGARMKFDSGAISVFGVDGNRVFDARALHCTIDARRLLIGKIAVNDIVVEEPHVALTVVDGGLVGVPLPAGGAWHVSFIRVDIDRVRMHHGTLEVTLPPRHDGLAEEGVMYRPAVVRLSGIDVVATADGGDEHRVFVSADGAEVLRGDDVVLRGDPLAVELWAGGDSLLAIDRVTIPGVAIRSGSLDIMADGVINLPIHKWRRSPAVDVELRADTTLMGVGPLADLNQRFAGVVAVVARATSARSGKVDVDGDVAVRDLFVNNMALGTIGGHVHAEDADAVVTGATWELGDSVIHGQAHGELAGRLPFHVDATGDRFSLYRFFQELHFSRGPWVEAHLAGDVAADGALVPFVLAGHGSGTADDVAVAGRDVRRTKAKERVLDVARRVRVDVDFRADQTSLLFPRGVVDDGVTSVNGAVELFVNKARGFTVDVASPSLSLATFRDHIGPLSIAAHASGVLRVSGPYARPLAHATVHAHDLVVERFALGDGDGKIDATTNAIALDDVVLRKGRSKVRSQLTLDYARTHAASRTGTAGSVDVAPFAGKPPHLALDIRLDGARAEDLRAIIPRPTRDPGLAALRDLALDGPLTGAVRARGYVGDHTARHLDAESTLAAAAGATLYGVPVDGRTLQLRLRDGHVVVGGIR